MVKSTVKLDLEYHDEQDWGDRGQPQIGLKTVLEADGCNSVNSSLQTMIVEITYSRPSAVASELQSKATG